MGNLYRALHVRVFALWVSVRLRAKTWKLSTTAGRTTARSEPLQSHTSRLQRQPGHPQGIMWNLVEAIGGRILDDRRRLLE
jgi:hypothetical protein